MNTLYFKYIIEVERTQSITQAADNLFIAQPNLSKAIRELENSLGFEVFKRTSKGVIPTIKGLVFIEHARNIVSQLDEIEALNNPEKEYTNSLSISIPRSSYIAEGLTDFISGFDFSPGFELNFRETDSLQTIRDVAEGEYSFGIIRYKNEYEKYFADYLKGKGLQGELLWEFDNTLIVSKDHPLALSHTIDSDNLNEYTEILYGDNTVPYIDSEKLNSVDKTSAYGKRIYIYERGSQFELLSRISTAYMWDSPTPEHMLTRYGLVQLSGKSCCRCKDIIISMREKEYTDLEKKLIDGVYQAKNRVAFN